MFKLIPPKKIPKPRKRCELCEYRDEDGYCNQTMLVTDIENMSDLWRNAGLMAEPGGDSNHVDYKVGPLFGCVYFKKIEPEVEKIGKDWEEDV